MEKKNNFHLPILTLKEIKPLLKKDEKVLANELKAATIDGDLVSIYENKGLDLSNYIGKKIECLLEITKGRFKYKDQKGKIPLNTIELKFQWLKRPYEFFPELVKKRTDLREADSTDEDSKREIFETGADKFFKEWGLNGLQIGIYEDKPVFTSPIGIFLVNQFEFEEDIENMELDEVVYIQIEEVFLRGIRPIEQLVKKETIKQKEKTEELSPKESIQDTKKPSFIFVTPVKK